MGQSLDNCVISILNNKEEKIGTGFIVSNGFAVTCAHVISASLSQPGDTISIIFYKTEEIYKARVLHTGWSQSEDDDIAFLRLIKIPEEAMPVKMAGASDSILHQYTSLGFPRLEGSNLARRPNGFINGLVSGFGKNDLLEIKGDEIYLGMSGAPVLDVNIDRVVGMVSAYKNDTYTRIAYATPADTIEKYYRGVFKGFGGRSPLFFEKNFRMRLEIGPLGVLTVNTSIKFEAKILAVLASLVLPQQVDSTAFDEISINTLADWFQSDEIEKCINENSVGFGALMNSGNVEDIYLYDLVFGIYDKKTGNIPVARRIRTSSLENVLREAFSEYKVVIFD